ncbi:MAG: OmpA family protein [Elusimicrobia bacterium]|nr:OmpA family protein [Elusimicrobiota bacterium]
MSRQVVLFLAFLGLGSAGLVTAYLLKPRLAEWKQRRTSDSRDMKATLRIGVDNWVGYFPLCSPEMKKRMRGAKYLLQCVDDSADYPARMKALRAGELELAVATVDSFLLNGAPERFPGVIAAVIDESKGGDAIVGAKNRVRSIDQLKTRPGLTIAFTPASPSEHLLKSVAVHFDIPVLRERKGAWRVEADGSPAALKKLERGEVDAAVLWEPDVSRAASQERFVKLLGTESTRRLIVDVLLLGRDFAAKDPQAVKVLLANYFRTLQTYQRDPESLTRDLIVSAKLDSRQVEAMLKGVAWASLAENAKLWLGLGLGGELGEEGLVDTIESSVQILVESGDFDASPVPQGDPYRLVDSSFIEELAKSAAAGQFGLEAEAAGGQAASLQRDFPPLDDAGWSLLHEVGTLKVRPITFQSGTADLSNEGKAELDAAASHLKHYPGFRVVLKGHTGRRGDAAKNRVLAQERSEAVRRYLTVTHGIDGDRLRPLGLGASAPLSRLPGESDRAYDYRLPRVELYLVMENL